MSWSGELVARNRLKTGLVGILEKIAASSNGQPFAPLLANSAHMNLS